MSRLVTFEVSRWEHTGFSVDSWGVSCLEIVDFDYFYSKPHLSNLASCWLSKRLVNFTIAILGCWFGVQFGCKNLLSFTVLVIVLEKSCLELEKLNFYLADTRNSSISQDRLIVCHNSI